MHYYRWYRHGDPTVETRVRHFGEPCAVDGCDEPARVRQFCGKHCQRERRTGDPLQVTRLDYRHFIERGLTEADYFWSLVEQDGECWVWMGGTSHGYGAFRARTQAHRYSYEFMVAEIPPGLELDHLCRNPPCVNPYHLDPVPGRVNNLRGVGAAAMNARKTHCRNGHEFTLENTALAGEKGRRCRTCQREGRVRREQQRRAA